jgi:HEAT repeat protein
MPKTNWSQLIEDLRGEDIDRLVNAYQKIDEVADKSHVPELYSLLNDENFVIREAAASPLARLEGAKVLPHLFQAYTRGFQDGHDNDGLSATITDLLEEKAEESAPLLLEMLQSSDSETRANAAWALGFTASQIKPNVLLDLLETENNPEVRLAVIGSLSSFTGSSEVAEKLISLLSNTDEQVRINVISSLGYLGNKMAIAPLKELLNETTNSRIREFIEYALKNLGAL